MNGMEKSADLPGDGLGEGFSLSHRTFVNTWECDENHHWNVQFYSRAFQHAAETFWMMHARENPGGRCARMRHIRYHRELHAADSVTISSAVIGDGSQAGKIVHLMHESQSGRLCATALDQPEIPVPEIAVVNSDLASEAMPRGLSGDRIQPFNGEALLKGGLAVVSNIRPVRTHELDHAGMLIANEIVSRITDGAPHAWHHAGITTEWLQTRNLGRVAVEKKLCVSADCASGDVVRVISWLGGVERRTLVLHHQLENVADGTVIALAEVKCLVMDLARRKAAELPDFLTHRKTAK